MVANDYDITKNKITFSIDENDYFIVQSIGGSSRTETMANLITKQTLTKIQPPITVQITAMVSTIANVERWLASLTISVAICSFFRMNGTLRKYRRQGSPLLAIQ